MVWSRMRIDAFADKNNEDEAWPPPNEDHPPEHYTQQLETFDEQEYTKEDYADSSTRLLDCAGCTSIKTITAPTRPDVREVFRLVYERATGVRLDGKMDWSMRKVLRKLAKKHGLKKIGRDKACMYVEDLAPVLQTNLSHVFLGMLFCDQAFAAYNLTSPEELSRLDIAPDRNELPLSLNPELDNVPVFRKAVRTPDSWAISPTEPLPYSTLLPWARALGQITAFAQVTHPYPLGYARGKASNGNGSVSEAMQNLMIGQASIATFLKHHISRRITVDTQAVP
ncbi:hypothetical protein GQ44DRAFT_770455 [Phaeosphaeriaceae sp. PMI808]|nr:hypothetical protein GQ44DRAFT_770455 [Phaeosphaeriaceae sp. PMI808]